MGKLDELTVQGRDVQCALSDAMLSRVADLVLRLHQDETQRQGAILPPAMMRSYTQRSESEREGMRAACKHVVVALVLLGVIDAPDL
jgi:hypothetical protein